MGVTAPAGDYPRLFRAMMARSAEAILRQVLGATRLTAEEREQALHTLTYVLGEAELWAVTRALLLALAPHLEKAGYRESWLDYIVQGLSQSQQLGDDEAEGQLHFHLGLLYQHLVRYPAARTHYARSAALFERRGEGERQARALNRLAYVARLEQKLSEASHLAEQALALLPDGAGHERAYSYLVRGAVAAERREWAAACHAYEHALSLANADNKRLVGWLHINLGAALRGAARYEEAIQSLEQGMWYLRMVDDPIHLASAAINLGNVYLYLQRYEEALAQYEQAEPTLRAAQDTLRIASIGVNRGMAQVKLERWEAARESYQHAIDLWQQLALPEHQVNTLDLLGEMYLAKKEWQAAYETLQLAVALLPQIKDEVLRQKMAEEVYQHLAIAERHLSLDNEEPS